MNNETVISVQNLSKLYKLYASPKDRVREFLNPFGRKYHRAFWALTDVSLEVKKGETVGIIGRNGSGKSTLLQIICGVIQPTRGSIHVSGRISALLELGAGFNPEFTGRENVYMNGTIMGLSKKEMDERFDSIASFAEIGDFIDAPVKTYSSGMFVRLAFASAINVDPDLLVIDEVLAVGDMGFQQKCFDQLDTMQQKGMTLLIVTHDIHTVKRYCSRAIYLKAGAVESQGEPEDTTESYLKDFHKEQQRQHVGEAIGWKRIEHGKKAFGTSHGTICDFSLGNGDVETDVFSSGDPLTIRVTARVDKTIRNPEIVFQIRDSRGYAIYGTGSIAAGVTFTDLRGDSRIGVAFSFRVGLTPGRYSIVLGLVDHISYRNRIVHEKIIGALHFSIKENDRQVNGVVDLNVRGEKLKLDSEC